MRRPVPAVLLAAALSLLATACSDKASDAYGPPPGGDSAPGAGSMAAEFATVRHILIKMKGRSGQGDRTRDEALDLAKQLIADVQAGRRTFDELILKFTDDRDANDKPGTNNNGAPGSYTLARGPGANQPGRESMHGPEAFENAVFATPVGTMTPEPIETPYGFHIIFRDK